MQTDLIAISRLLICAFEVFMLDSFIGSLFQRRRQGEKHLFGFILTTALVFLVNGLGITQLNLFAVPAIYLGFVLYGFKLSKCNAIVYTMLFYIVFMGVREVAFEMLYRMCSAMFPIYIAPWFKSEANVYLLAEDVLGFLFLLFMERYTAKIDIDEESTFSWCLLIMPLSTVLVLTSFLYMDFPTDPVIQVLICCGAFLLYFSNAAIFIILEKFSNAMNQIKRAELYMVKEDLEKKSFNKVSKLNEHYRNYIHDMSFYLKSIGSLAGQGENKRIIGLVEELEGKLKIGMNDKFYISNPVLNAIILNHVQKAKEAGIEISIFIEPRLNVDFVSDGDLISIFGNLLDNSVEAASKCKAGKKYIDFKLYRINDYLMVCHIENSHIMEVVKEGGRLLTTKKEKEYHGLGVGIVTELAERYGGSLNLEERNDCFVTVLSLSSFVKKKSVNF